MISVRTFRSNPHFAELFAHVHVMCWPILWWQLNALRRWCAREGIPDVLYSVSTWGFITVRHYGAHPDPALYAPIARTFRPLTDRSWNSDMPIVFEIENVHEAIATAFSSPARRADCEDQESDRDFPGKAFRIAT